MESIKSILVAKLQTVKKTLPDLDLADYLESVKSWKFDWFQQQASQRNLSQIYAKQQSTVSQQFLSPLT